MLKHAVSGHVPLLRCTTDDLIHVEYLLTETLPNLTVGKLPTKQVCDVYFHMGAYDKSLRDLYIDAEEKEYTVIFINTEYSPEMLNVGELIPSKQLVYEFLLDNIPKDLAEEATRYLYGWSYQGIKQVISLCSVYYQSITIKTLRATKNKLSTRQVGIVPVSVETDFFFNLSKPLRDWINTNREYMFADVDVRLVPKGILLHGAAGCIGGGSLLNYRRGKRGSSRPLTMKQLYEKFNGIEYGGKGKRWDLNINTYLYSMTDNDALRYNKIIAVIESGIRAVYRVTTESGEWLECTYDHPIASEFGDFLELGELPVGSIVRIKGSGLALGHTAKKVRPKRKEICIKHHPIAGLKIVNGCTYKRTAYARIVMESVINNLPVDQYITKLNTNDLAGLEFLASGIEVHHKDENTLNDSPDNLLCMSKEEHAREHSKVENFNFEYMITDKIVSVDYVREEMTYDIQMEAPDHNFVCGGFIVHNTGKTEVARYVAREWNIPLFLLDINSMLSKWQGEAESHLNKALDTFDVESPCVVLFDEVEKLFSSNSENDTSQRLLSRILWWLQLRESKVMVIMTCNNMDIIPPELYRAGRISTVFEMKGVPKASVRIFITQLLKSFEITSSTVITKALKHVGTVKGTYIPHAQLNQLVIDYLQKIKHGI